MSDVQNEIMQALDKIDAKYNELEGKVSKKAEKEFCDKLGVQQHEMCRELAAIQQAQAKGAAEAAPAPSTVGGRFTAGDAYKAFAADVRNSRGARELVFTDPTPTPTPSTVASSISRNTIAAPYQVPGIVASPELPLLVESLIPHVAVNTSAVEYLKGSSFTNGAGVVAEGAAKPETTFGFSLATASVVTVAHWTKITEQLAADAPAVEAYINSKMLYGLALTVDRQLVTGTGSGQLSGLLKSGNFTDYSSAVTVPTGGTLIDFALLIKNHMESLGYPPEALVLNPADWTAIALAKDEEARYLLGGPASIAGKTLWGIPVVTTAAVTSGKYILANFRMGATIFDRQEVAVEVDREQDDFTKNLLTIRVERRLGLAVEDPAAIGGGDWSLS